MAVLTPAGGIHGTGSIPPVETGFGGGGNGEHEQQPPRGARPHLDQIGILVGLASVASFFGALSLVYAIILGQSSASPGRFHVPTLLYCSTALILASSFALERVRYALRRGLVVRSIFRLRVTLILGGAFLTSQLLSWVELARQGVSMGRNPRGSVFYVFTGAHGLHVVGGILWLAYLLRRTSRLGAGGGGWWSSEQELRKLRRVAGAAALYWHFLGALWVFLFVLLLVWS